MGHDYIVASMKPLLAVNLENPTGLPYPVYASDKLDGIRCLTGPAVIPGNRCTALTRSLKSIKNEFIRDWIESNCDPGLDGEIMIRGEDGKFEPFGDISSAVMSVNGQPDFEYWVFDCVKWNDSGEPFKYRTQLLCGRRELHDAKTFHRVRRLNQMMINSEAELDAFETDALLRGHEGIMVRRMDGIYKFGRSTEKEAILLKVKRFKTDEAKVFGIEEEMENTNEKTLESGGKAKRSSHQAGMKGKGRMGKLIVEDIKTGERFGLGTGFTAAQRQKIWDEWNTYDTVCHKIVTYKHQPHGAKDKPRIPVFIGFRDISDL